MPIELTAVPLSVLLIPYGIFLLVFLGYAAFNVFQLRRFGFRSHGLSLVILVFLTVSLVLLAGSALWLLSFDWSADITPAALFSATL